MGNPSIDKETYRRRRALLVEQIGEGVAIVPGARLARRAGDVDYVFRQHSDLLYLTGFDQPQALAVLTREKFVLFVQPRDPAAETWTGRRPGIDGARSEFGADESHPIGELASQLPDLLENAPRVYYELGRDRRTDDLLLDAIDAVRARARTGVTAPTEIRDLRVVLHEMRLRKAPEEVEVMRAAADISREAHRDAARMCTEGTREYEIEAMLSWVFRRRGGSGPAYPSVVGSGDNATILHYIENTGTLREELCELTRIPHRSLERLEEGVFDQVDDGFVRGFVRTVAEALGLDSDDTVARMCEEPSEHDAYPPISVSGLGRLAVVFAGLVLILISAGLVSVAAQYIPGRTDATLTTLRRDPVRLLAEAQGVSGVGGDHALVHPIPHAPPEVSADVVSEEISATLPASESGGGTLRAEAQHSDL